MFSSNRSGNTDIWTLDTETEQVRQITDDQSEDWDPAFSVDGESLFWSSNRGGALEIWTARADGSQARQISNDGVDAENPTQTPNGEWVVYASGNPEKDGIWKMRPDGTDATHVARGAYFLPEVAPDNLHASFVANDVTAQQSLVRVASLETGELVFETGIPFTGLQPQISPGRSRWSPDGNTIYFLVPTAEGTVTLVAQDFRPGENTDATRRIVMEAQGGEDIESFGISPDGSSVTFARISHFRGIKTAEGDFSR